MTPPPARFTPRDLLIAAGWKPGPDSYLHNDKGERLTIDGERFIVAGAA